MNSLDWIVLFGTLVSIVTYGVWKTRNIRSSESYLLGDRDLPWWTIGLSIMATQASAITFLSTPGKAYSDGMGFAQFYFGLPIAMVILCVFVLPIYYRLKVYTAYEYLESRFDVKTRSLTAFLFLVQRGLAAGLTIYAPAIILSSILDWELSYTNLLIGVLVIIYTVAGGTKAVSQTQKQQMVVILLGMIAAFVVLVNQLPEDVSFGDAVGIAGKMDKLEVVSFEFDLSDRYNIWSALLGGTFLFLSYFGTDQSQVSRYLGGKSLTESRMGLLFNGIFKVPMQFLILFVGIMVYVFFQFNQPPIHFNPGNIKMLEEAGKTNELDALRAEQTLVFDQQQQAIRQLISAMNNEDQAAINQARVSVNNLQIEDGKIRDQVKSLIATTNPEADTKDDDYVFINFVITYLPAGLVGLLLAVIFSAAMSSTASELNALATTTVVDFYKRSWNTTATDLHYLSASKWFTALWGCIALLFAMTASLFDNLIEAVNIVGSLFYGTILGVFVVAFFFKKINGTATFWAAVLAEIIVIVIYFNDVFAYLWLNLVGCLLVVALAWMIQMMRPGERLEKV